MIDTSLIVAGEAAGLLKPGEAAALSAVEGVRSTAERSETDCSQSSPQGEAKPNQSIALAEA